MEILTERAGHAGTHRTVSSPSPPTVQGPADASHVTMASSSSFGCQLSEGFLDDIEHEFRRMEAGGDVDEVQGRLNVLDQVMLTSTPLYGLYGRGIEYARRWSRTSGRLPSHCMLAGISKESLALLHQTPSSDVYRGQYENTLVAVKVIRLLDDGSKALKQSQKFRSEVITWRYLRHPNIVPFLGISDVFPLCLVSEWMEGGTIIGHYKKSPLLNRCKHIRDIVDGLKYLHGLHVIHGDLKPVNILLDLQGNARLGDFGITKVLYQSPVTATAASINGVSGTTPYMSPELFSESCTGPTAESDTYALAMTIWELFALERPFHETRPDLVVQKILSGRRPEKPRDCSSKGLDDIIWRLMQRSWEVPSKRPPLSRFLDATTGSDDLPPGNIREVLLSEDGPEGTEHSLREHNARVVSDGIDALLRRERQDLRRRNEFKVLLLGDSMSGVSDKSNVIKGFELLEALHLVLCVKGALEAIMPPASEKRNLDSKVLSSLGLGGSPFRTPPNRQLYERHSLALAPFLALENPLRRALEGAVDAFSYGRADSPHGRANPEGHLHALWRAHAPAIQAFCTDTWVQAQLAKKKISIDHVTDAVDRIVTTRSSPTEDVVRLQNMGVVEYSFTLGQDMRNRQIESTNRPPIEWKLYDIRGDRSQRLVWARYFNDVSTMIFLAPICAFDEVLDEISCMNRLEDTLCRWRSVVSESILFNTPILLFLTGCNVLRDKLAAGTRLSDYMVSYGNRPNDYKSVIKYVCSKFLALHDAHSANKQRMLRFEAHLSADIDVQHIISFVKDTSLHAAIESSTL